LAPLPRKRLPPATSWLAFGPGRPLGLSTGVDIASLRLNGVVVSVRADHHLAMPAIAATAKPETICSGQRFGRQTPLNIDHDFDV